MALINSDLPTVTTCNQTCIIPDLPTPADQCLGEFVSVYPEVITLWFNCNATLENDWATAADIITDLTAITPVAVGNKLRWDGKVKKERTTITRAAGLPDVAGAWSQTIEFYSENRDEANADYDYFNSLIDKSNTGTLHMAYITRNDDIYFYRTPVSLVQSDDIQSIDNIEQINITMNATGSGVGMTTPIRIAGVYDAVLPNL